MLLLIVTVKVEFVFYGRNHAFRTLKARVQSKSYDDFAEALAKTSRSAI